MAAKEPPWSVGPFQRIVNVGWPSDGIYVLVWTHANLILGVNTTPHHATVALTDAGKKAGGEIVLQIEDEGDRVFGIRDYFGISVIKFKNMPKSGPGFKLNIQAPSFFAPSEPDHVYLCGHFSFEDNLVRISDIILPGPLGPVIIPQWTYSWSTSNPLASESGSVTLIGEDPIPGWGPKNISYNVLYYIDAGEVVQTTLPCTAPAPGPATKLPFEVTVRALPIKDHIVSNPGLAQFYAIDKVVQVKGSPLGGFDTYLWEIVLAQFNNVGGIATGVIDFVVGKFPLTKNPDLPESKFTKIFQVYPTSPIVGLSYDAFGGPSYRKKNNGSDPVILAWDGVRLLSGAAPPPLASDPRP